MTYTADAYFKHGHGDQPVRVTSPEEVNHLIDAMLGEPFLNSLAMIYLRDRPEMDSGGPDHQIRLGVNAEDKVGSICLVVDGKIWYTKGDHTRADEVFYNYMGNAADFPADSEVPLDTLRTTLKEILAGGVACADSAGWSEVAG